MVADSHISEEVIVKVFCATLQNPGVTLNQVAEIVREEEKVIEKAITFLINNFFFGPTCKL